MAVYDRWRRALLRRPRRVKFEHPCPVCRKAGYQHKHGGRWGVPSLHPPASMPPMTSLPPAKPACPKCGTSGCLEDKALDF